MEYVSTRQTSASPRVSFEEAVLNGLAPDGGLYVPVSVPSLPEDWESKWSQLSFQELALEIYSLFIPQSEMSRSELQQLIQRSYATFRHPDIAPLVRLSDRQQVLELFHGPTFAFKDVALQFLGNLFEFFLTRKNAAKKQGEKRERLTVIGATSGDTGSAAIYGLRGKQDVSIFILHPKGRVSPIQEAQMTTVTDANVYNLAVSGTFDDCQDIVKTLFGDKQMNDKYNFGAVNSINWARILAQIVYYFSAYFYYRKAGGSGQPQFVVPTGNFGDILAGWYAKRLGLPTEKLGIATNENDILQRFWSSGKYEKASSVGGQPGATNAMEGQGGVKETLAPAMDILVSSNFERLIWSYATEALGKDQCKAGEQLQKWMADLKSSGKADLTMVHDQAKAEFMARRVSDVKILETIRDYRAAETKYIADPHTAIGLAAAKEMLLETQATQLILSTAHPAKFSAAVEKALEQEAGFDFNRDILPKEFEGLLDRERKVLDVKGEGMEQLLQGTKQVLQHELRELYGL